MPSPAFPSLASIAHLPPCPTDVRRSTPQTHDLTAASATQKAPVFHYTCLFTHDVRRKNTKRWQDGHLSLHSFNKRVMVYDESRNYIGDTFSKDGGEVPLEDGDELTLDRVGVLVQVGERRETQDTDLTELLARRAPKPVEAERSQDGRLGESVRPLRLQNSNLQIQARRKWTGWEARPEITSMSPHELRRVDATKGEYERRNEPPRKRQRQDDEHVPLWQILKTSRPPRSRALVFQSSSTGPQTRQIRQTTKPCQLPAAALKNIRSRGGQKLSQDEDFIDVTGQSSDHVQSARPAPSPSDSDGQKEMAPFTIDMSPRTLPAKSPGLFVPSQTSSGPGGVWKYSPANSARSDMDQAQTYGGTQSAEVSFIDIDQLVSTNTELQMGPRNDDNRVMKVNSKEKRRKTTLAMSSIKVPERSRKRSEKSRPRSPGKTTHNIGISHPTGTEADGAGSLTCRPAASPLVSTTSHLTGTDFPDAIAGPARPADQGKAVRAKQPTKPLRLTSAAPKRTTLFCQALSAPSSREPSSGKARGKTLLSKAWTEKTIAPRSCLVENTPKNRNESRPEVNKKDNDDSEWAFEIMSLTKFPQDKQHWPVGVPTGNTHTGPLELGWELDSPLMTDRPQAGIVVKTLGDHIEAGYANERNRPVLNYGTARLDAHFLASAAPHNAAPAQVPSAPEPFSTPAGIENMTDRASPPLALVPNKSPSTSPTQSENITGVAKFNDEARSQRASATTVHFAAATALARPFRRVASGILPNKTRCPRKNLKRSETISFPEEVHRYRVEGETRMAQEVHRAAEEGEDGPWSREAWDLFGDVPAGRLQGVHWIYSVDGRVNVKCNN